MISRFHSRSLTVSNISLIPQTVNRNLLRQDLSRSVVTLGIDEYKVVFNRYRVVLCVSLVMTFSRPTTGLALL